MRRWIATHFAEEVARERVTVPRGPVDAGSEAQIDYGRLGMWFDPATARRVAVWAFVMVLAFSRHLFVRPVIRMDQTAWCACHVAAFEFFDGVPARLVCDNLRTGVDKPDLYDPQINRSYAELASHYATLVDPARARKPKDKPRVERPMTYVRDSFWKGREFDSLAQMQQAAVTWSTEVAGLRYLRALEGAQPLRMFEAVEQQALIALPPRAFELTSWSIGTVGVDTHLKVGKALYSVPWRLIGQRLHARTAGDVVQIFAGNDVVATHVRRPSGRSTDFSHYPPEKIAFHMRTPTWCRHTAELVGPACQQVIAEFMRDNAIHHLVARRGPGRVPDGIDVHLLPFPDLADDDADDSAPHETAFKRLLTNDGSNGESGESSQSINDAATRYMTDEYRQFPTRNGAQRALHRVVTLLAAGRPVLTHCFAGKDRTGFVVALVLEAVGLDRDVIVADYLRSNDSVPQLRARISEMIQQRFDTELAPEVVTFTKARLSDGVLGVRAEYLAAARQTIDETYGSLGGYLRDAGISQATVNRMRGVLLG